MSPVAISSSQLSFFPGFIAKANGFSVPTTSNPPTRPGMANHKAPTEVQNVHIRSSFTFDSMEDALAAFARGEFLIVMDDEDRENEGDLIIAASSCTTEKMAWMIKHTRYVNVCLNLVCTLIVYSI